MSDQYEPNCPVSTLDSLFRLLKDAELTLEEAKAKKDAVLRMIAEEAGKTFRYNGVMYQIGERYNKTRDCKVPFLKTLKTTPAEWLSKKTIVTDNHEQTSITDSSEETVSAVYEPYVIG